MLRTGVVMMVLLLLAACGDPLAGVPRLQDIELAETDPAAAALPSAEEVEREGFFGTDAATGEAGRIPAAAPTAAPEPRRGIFGLFRRSAPSPADPAPVASQEASLTAPAEASAQPEEPAMAAPQRKDFFARLGGASAPDAQSNLLEVDYGTVVPYGVLARSCASKRKSLGKKVDATAGFKLYDSNPGLIVQRTFYITGFGDGCPRQFTAAQALLGAPSLYEQLHYGPAGAHLAYGDTDKAYEKVKRDVCGARKGKPCGSAIRRLERSTVFVNTYDRATDNRSWSEVLIHQGEVMARSNKSSG